MTLAAADPVQGALTAGDGRGLATGAALRAPRELWMRLGILTGFWSYVALSNVLYAENMQATLRSMGAANVFAPWQARLLQHALLFPALLVCMWLSRRVGWQPLWRAVPLQLLCGLAFSMLASPALLLGERLVGDPIWHRVAGQMMEPPSANRFEWIVLPIWFASATSALLAYFFGVALLTGFDFYRRLRDTQVRAASLERSLSEAHLAALRMQLSPHTLFNLLHTIRGQIAWDPAAAQSMVVQLGDLLRRVLRAGDREFTLLRDELEFARLYLGLQQQRFADRLTVSVADAGELPAVWVPSLILQPLIENAAVHGLAGGEKPVVIRVDASASGETLTLRVVNSVQPGRAPGAAGVGLRNVRERLAIHFGGRASFSATPGADDSWVAEVRMPLLRNP